MNSSGMDPERKDAKRLGGKELLTDFSCHSASILGMCYQVA